MSTSRRTPAAGERSASRQPDAARVTAAPPAGAAIAGRDTLPAPRRPKPSATERWIYGRHAVRAALANPARHWHELAALTSQEGEARMLAGAARAAHRRDGGAVRILDRAGLAALLPEGAVHQGLALRIDPLAEPDLDELLTRLPAGSSRQVVVALDRVADPHNVGAVLRSAAGFGAAAVLVLRQGAPPVSGALAKAASGAVESVPLVRVVNLSRTLDRLKRAGFWICGLDAGAATPLSALALGARVVVVLGSEGGGLRRLVRLNCDHLARLPTRPAQPTLNVSNAAAVALYELMGSAAAAEIG